MRAETLFWWVTYVLAGSVAVYALARLGLWWHQRRQARQLQEFAARLDADKDNGG